MWSLGNHECFVNLGLLERSRTLFDLQCALFHHKISCFGDHVASTHVQVGVHVGIAFDHEFVVCDRDDVVPSSSFRHGTNLRDAVKRRFATIYGEIAFEKRAREE